MKRVISFIILFIISSTIIFSTGEYGAVRGKISGGKAVIYNMREEIIKNYPNRNKQELV